MKKVITFILVMCWIMNSYSQKVIQLKETQLTFVPSAKMLLSDYDNGVFIIKEAYAYQFQNDAIKFLNDNFDIFGYMESVKNEKYDSYLVLVRSNKGFLRASYNKNGEMERTYQKFKNIPLPKEISNELFLQRKGWTMAANTYISKSKGDIINEERYIVQIINGNKKEKVKIYPKNGSITVATIEK